MRRGGAGAIAHNGLIYVVAGIQNGHTDGHVAWFDAFDPATGAWTQLPDAPRTRDHFQVAIVDDKLYAIGGRRSSAATGQTFELTVPEVDVYDFATGEAVLASIKRDEAPGLIRALVEQGVDIREARWVGTDLESIFFTETGSVQMQEADHAG